MNEPTAAELLERVHERFAAAELYYGHGTDNPWDEAVAVVLGITGLPDEFEALSSAIEPDHVRAIERVAAARIETRQPLAYLLGRCQYMGLEFAVEPGVIVPRSPIGYLLHEGLEAWLPGRVSRILDLCAGGGCLGIVAAHCFPEAEVVLVENDAAALSLAQRNVVAHGLTERVEVVAGNAAAPLDLGEPFQLVLSNPPYVSTADMRNLPAEYRAEPSSALAAGAKSWNSCRCCCRQMVYLSAKLAPVHLPWRMHIPTCRWSG